MIQQSGNIIIYTSKNKQQIMRTNEKGEKQNRTKREIRINSQHPITTAKKVQSTAIGMSNKFRQINIDEQVKEFTQQPIQIKTQINNPRLFPYQKCNLIKDVNYLNSIYNHILIMISSHLNKLGESKNYQVVKMSNQIQRIILENIKLKEQIDASYQNMNNLEQLANYLKTNINDINHGKLENFLNDFQAKQKQAKELSLELQNLRANIKQKNNIVTNQKIRQKEKKCKMYRKMIEKQKQRIAKYQTEQKNLLKKLYKTQRQILKNEHSTSAIKLYFYHNNSKINEVRFSQQKKIRSKTRQGKISQKENIQINKQKKNMKIQQTQKLKFLHRNRI